MILHNAFSIKIFIAVLCLLLVSCAAGNDQFTANNLAGFWYGLWHGIISVISLIVHVFNNDVAVYEINNAGGWYDFGFLVGVICVWSGGSHVSCKTTADKKRDKEWEEIGSKVEVKIMHKLKEWAKDEEDVENDGDWKEVSEKAEKKLKRKIREWAEKD